MHGILDRARRNVVAWVALFVALGGTSVAAVSLANHSIDPVKLDPRTIGGYVREWASVDANGHVTASGGRVTVRLEPFPGRYYVSWRTHPTSPCTVVGNVDTGRGSAPGYLTGGVNTVGGRTASILDTYDPQGQLSPLPFEVELLCATPR